jgi:hypothetical protein
VESNHVIPRYQRGAVTVWLTPSAISRGGLGSVRTSPCRVSTGRSAIRASRPCATVRSRTGATGDVQVGVKESPVFASSGTLGPAAGIEPAASRLRGERPCLQDLAGTVASLRRDGVAGGIRTLIPGVAGRDPRRWTTTTGGAVVRWFDGAVVRWFDGAVVRWTPGRDSHPRDTVCSRAPRSSATGRCAAREGLEPPPSG